MEDTIAVVRALEQQEVVLAISKIPAGGGSLVATVVVDSFPKLFTFVS